MPFINSRTLICALLGLLAGRSGGAAEPVTFARLDHTPGVVWSVAPLSKGEVVEVHAFKAPPQTIVFLGICNDYNCANVHVVKNVPAYRSTVNNVTEKYTLEESGHLVFWTAAGPRPELNAGASKALSNDSHNPVAGAIHSGFSGLYTGAEVMRFHTFDVEADGMKVRYDAGCYITLRRIGTATPQ